MKKQLISKSAYARHRKVTKGRVSQWLSEGRLVTSRGLVDVIASDQMLEATAPCTMNGGKNGHSSPAMEAYRKEMTRRAAAGAALLELTAAERAGKLVKLEIVMTEWDNMLITLRNRLLAMPRVLAAPILTVGTPQEAEAMLMDYIRAALENLANYAEKFPAPEEQDNQDNRS